MYDIIFIGDDTLQWKKLKDRVAIAKRAKSLEAAKKMSLTRMFWVVWAGLDVNKDFDFSYKCEVWDEQYIHVFKNDDEYNGITLFPKTVDISNIDIENRVYKNVKYWDIVASNTSVPGPYDIVFISYNETNADQNYAALIERFPMSKRIHGVKGIHQAHIAAATECFTDMFWIVDGDAQIVDDFDFSYIAPDHQRDHVHVWRSQNPVNNLIYGYGGVKLFPRNLTLQMDISKPDMTTSISDKFKVMPEISNITSFNSDPFSTWRSAFRECAKLSSKVIDRQNEDETAQRLTTWCTVGEQALYGTYAIAGAKAGAAYGARNKDNLDALGKINNFDWLKEQFDATNI